MQAWTFYNDRKFWGPQQVQTEMGMVVGDRGDGNPGADRAVGAYRCMHS